MPGLLHIFALGVILVIASCAQINPLSGGERDTTAPQLDSARTYPLSGTTNFTDKEVKIKFDEYIKLNKPSDNIIITPQLKNKPEITAHNKKLSIIFQEDLEPNTTYTISFNGAIQDITEGNDSVFQYVFSTGDYIDSLSLSGQLKNAFTNGPEKGWLVGMYPVITEQGFDTLAATTKPTYIAQTGNTGNFSLNYLKSGRYFLFAIEDKNRNMLYDEGEGIAFPENPIITLDSVTSGVQLASFKESGTDELRISSTRFTHPGKLTFILDGADSTTDFSVTTSMDLLQEETNRHDSLIFWLSSNPTARMQFFVSLNGEKDTLKPVYSGIPDKDSDPSVQLTSNVFNTRLKPGENLKIISSEPISRYDQGGFRFYDKDSAAIMISSQQGDLRTIEFESAHLPVAYMEIDSAALTSVYNNINSRNQRIIFENYDSSWFGTLILNVDTLFSVPVIVELMDKSGDVVRRTSFGEKLVFQHMAPGNYRIRLIFDRNNDGEWTTGSVSEGRQPEGVLYFKGEVTVKSKWEKEVDWKLKKQP